MDGNTALPELLSSLKNTLKLQSALIAKQEQREAHMQATFEQRMQALQSEVAQMHQRVDGITQHASAQIAKQAKEAIAPVTADYGRRVATTSADLRQAGRMVWLWLGTAATILVLVLLVAWSMLGYYRRELAASKIELQRYENAVPIVKAFYASDAVLCGDRFCANVDPRGPKTGDQGQYRPVKPRLQQ